MARLPARQVVVVSALGRPAQQRFHPVAEVEGEAHDSLIRQAQAALP